VSATAQERALGNWLEKGLRSIGQIAVNCRADGTFDLTHREDVTRSHLTGHEGPEAALELARFDDGGNYRPLKTAPTLRHGWRLRVETIGALWFALDHFYPGRLAAFLAFETNNLGTTALRETLERQSGMYRIAAQIEEEPANELVGNFCQSDGGCLRTILWRRDRRGTVPSTELPAGKFEPAFDQTGAGRPVIPLLCQEACNLLVAEARRVVQESRR
jgi:sirohydrochlorin cobaltochelatase